jgi:Holliday junction resolvasome RuvABC endonuclease subunit
MIVLGIDTGFENFGWSLVEVDKEGERLISLGLIRTKKSDKKTNTLASSDNSRRARKIASELREVIEKIEAAGLTINLVTVEGQSIPRNASVTFKIGIAWGVLFAFVEERGWPLLEATPMQIKVATAGIKTATKGQVEEAIAIRPGFEKLKPLLLKMRKSHNTKSKAFDEHPTDATGSVIACLNSDVVRLGRQF